MSTQETSKDQVVGGPSLKLFRPLKIRGLLLSNRIIVAPMGMYSGQDGHVSDFHIMHLGGFAFRGPGLTIAEVTAVLPTARTSPIDAGLWDDSHIEGWKRVVDFVHGLEGECKIGIQLGHSGRKGSMTPIYPGTKTKVVSKEEGGWEDEVWGASSVPFLPNYITPKEMSQTQINTVVSAFGDAADRAVRAGFDTIEIHAAHGYLVSSFLSPCSNNRTDLYGDSFENRIRLLVEIVKAIRDRIPDDMPLFVRISATDWMEYSPETPQWAIDDSVKLAVVLNNIGVDLIDVSSGGNNASQKVPAHDAFYQVKLAEQITQVLRNERKSMLVGAVGYINSATRARDVLEEQMADIVLVGREFMRSPGLVQTWAAELGLGVNYPRQYIKLNTASIGTA